MAAWHGASSSAPDSRKQLSRRAAPDFQISQRNSRFLFVNVDGEEEKNRKKKKDKRAGKGRSELRSHVMLVTSEGKRRQQMLETLFYHQQSTSPPTVSWEFDVHRADPFNTLPIRSTPAVDAAIKYFFNNYTGATPLSDDTLILSPTRPHPPRMSNTLWTLLSTTRATLSLLLYASTTLRDGRAAGSFAAASRECITYHAWALAAVRADLATLSDDPPAEEAAEPGTAISAARAEPSISAIAGLAAVAAGTGSSVEASHHYRAMLDLVERVGGQAAFGRFARRTLWWCEFHVVASLGGLPALALAWPGPEEPWEVRAPGAFVRAVDAAWARMGAVFGRGGTGEVVRGMGMVVLAQTRAWEREVDREVVADVLDAVETRLLVELDGLERRGGEPERSVEERVYAAVTHAAQIFLWGALAVNPIKFTMNGRFAEKLREALDGGDMWEVWDGRALLWVLFMGLTMAEEPAVGWFEENVFVALRLLGIEGEEELREVMGDFLWMDKLCQEPCRMLWRRCELYEDILGVVQGNFMF